MKKSPAPKSPQAPVRRGLPAWLKIIAGAAILFVVAAMVAPWFIPWDRLKQECADAGSRALGREVGIGRVDVGLFSGVRVRDLSLANAPGFSGQPLFSASEAKLQINPLSLLTGKVIINSITFIQPKLLFETDTHGVSNVRGLGATRASAPAQKAKASASSAQGTGGSKGGAFPVILAALVIRDASVTLVDHRTGTTNLIHGLNVTLKGFSLAAAGASSLELQMLAQVQGKDIPLSLSSDFRLDPSGPSLDISRMDFKAPGLAVGLTGTVRDFDGPVGDFRVLAEADLKNLPAIESCAQWQGKVEGKISVQAGLELRPSKTNAMLDGLQALARFQVKDGVIHRTEMQDRLAAALPYAPVQNALRSDIVFSAAQGQVFYGAGRATLKDFVLGSGADFRGGPEFIQASGFVEPGKGLDFKIVLHFNPSLGFPKGDLMKAFEDEKGWPSFDYIEYSGASFQSAKADFTKGIQKAADKAMDQIKGLFQTKSWGGFLGH